MSFPCPCCGNLTFEEQLSGTFEICPVCFWEDDNIQNDDHLYAGGANGISLADAKKNYKKYGAIKKQYLANVRPPCSSEKLKT